jgi:hypothetical protein
MDGYKEEEEQYKLGACCNLVKEGITSMLDRGKGFFDQVKVYRHKSVERERIWHRRRCKEAEFEIAAFPSHLYLQTWTERPSTQELSR